MFRWRRICSSFVCEYILFYKFWVIFVGENSIAPCVLYFWLDCNGLQVNNVDFSMTEGSMVGDFSKKVHCFRKKDFVLVYWEFSFISRIFEWRISWYFPSVDWWISWYFPWPLDKFCSILLQPIDVFCNIFHCWLYFAIFSLTDWQISHFFRMSKWWILQYFSIFFSTSMGDFCHIFSQTIEFCNFFLCDWLKSFSIFRPHPVMNFAISF